jgi:hypothetical protein
MIDKRKNSQPGTLPHASSHLEAPHELAFQIPRWGFLNPCNRSDRYCRWWCRRIQRGGWIVNKSTRVAIVVSCGLLIVPGCAHQQLRWNTVKQSQTLTDIYEQQVLDNLAMFVYDANSLPFFSFPNAGAADVNDEGNLTAGIDFTRLAKGFSAADIGLSGKRSAKESWTLTPIVDPRKLELMRCAYQQAISNCGFGELSTTCPNCTRAFNKFYTGNPNKPVSNDSGAVTSDCLNSGCWLGYGCSKCVPSCDPCIKVGHYCGLYVWVLPGGQNELTKLTLSILDYAFYPPAQTRQKEVEWYFTADGSPTTRDKAQRVERAAISLGTKTPVTLPPKPLPPQQLQKQDLEAWELEQQKAGTFEQSDLLEPRVPSPIPSGGYLQFQQNLQFLTPRSGP